VPVDRTSTVRAAASATAGGASSYERDRAALRGTGSMRRVPPSGSDGMFQRPAGYAGGKARLACLVAGRRRVQEVETELAECAVCAWQLPQFRRQVAKARRVCGIVARNPRRLPDQVGQRGPDEAFLDQRRSVTIPVQRFRMRRQRVAVGRELKRAETQHPALVAGQAVGHAWDTVALPGAISR